MNDKRKTLIALSTEAKALIESGETDFGSVNEVIVEEFYRDRFGEGDFKLFHGWRKDGRKVKKGEKGLPIWGRKQRFTKKVVNKSGDEEEKKWNGYKMAIVFHVSQTEPVEA